MKIIKLFRKSFFLSFAVVFTYFCLLLETVKYPGFIGNHFYIDAKVFTTVTLVLILFSSKRSPFLNFILKANRVLLPILSIVYLGLAALEGAKYTNYILATINIHLDGLVLMVLFSFFLFVADKYKNTMPKVIHSLRVIYPVMVLFIVYFVIKNIVYVADESVNRNFYIIFHPLSTYDQKMFYQWGEFYKFMVFVRNNTPDNATIVLPPMENPWLMGSGNPHFVRAFLYPRNIIQEAKIIPDTKIYGPNTFILITWGKEECQPVGCHGWPRQNIIAKEIIYKDPNSENTVEVRQNSVYKLNDNKYVYGVIEL